MQINTRCGGSPVPQKESYLEREGVQPWADRVAEEISPGKRARAGSFSPKRSALLCLDMQRFFFEPESHAFIPAAPEILPPISRLIDAFQRARRPIYATRHTNTPANAAMMGRWWRDLIAPESPESELIDPLQEVPELTVIEKHQYDAFHQTQLETQLASTGVEQLVVTGVMTHLCVETTIRSAFVRGFEVYFPLECSATYTESLHLASLRTLHHGFAYLARVGEIAGALRVHA